MNSSEFKDVNIPKKSFIQVDMPDDIDFEKGRYYPLHRAVYSDDAGHTYYGQCQK